MIKKCFKQSFFNRPAIGITMGIRQRKVSVNEGQTLHSNQGCFCRVDLKKITCGFLQARKTACDLLLGANQEITWISLADNVGCEPVPSNATCTAAAPPRPS